MPFVHLTAKFAIINADKRSFVYRSSTKKLLQDHAHRLYTREGVTYDSHTYGFLIYILRRVFSVDELIVIERCWKR